MAAPRQQFKLNTREDFILWWLRTLRNLEEKPGVIVETTVSIEGHTRDVVITSRETFNEILASSDKRRA